MRRLGAAAIVVALGLFGGAVVARFTSTPTTATATLNIATPTIPRPDNVLCSTAGTLVASAVFTWGNPPITPYVEPDWFVLRLRRPDGTTQIVGQVAGSAPNSATLNMGLLAAVISNIVDLLTGAQPITVSVNAVYGAYESPSSYNVRLVNRLVLPTGLGCSLTTPLAAPLSAPASAAVPEVPEVPSAPATEPSATTVFSTVATPTTMPAIAPDTSTAAEHTAATTLVASTTATPTTLPPPTSTTTTTAVTTPDTTSTSAPPPTTEGGPP